MDLSHHSLRIRAPFLHTKNTLRLPERGATTTFSYLGGRKKRMPWSAKVHEVVSNLIARYKKVEMIRWSDLCFCSCAHRRCLGACAISRPDWATSNVFMLLFFLSLAHLLSLKWQVCPKIHSEAIRACFDKHQDGAKDSYWSWYCLIFFCGYQWREGGSGMWVWPWYVWKHWGGRRDQHAGSPTRWTNCILYIFIYTYILHLWGKLA